MPFKLIYFSVFKVAFMSKKDQSPGAPGDPREASLSRDAPRQPERALIETGRVRLPGVLQPGLPELNPAAMGEQMQAFLERCGTVDPSTRALLLETYPEIGATVNRLRDLEERMARLKPAIKGFLAEACKGMDQGVVPLVLTHLRAQTAVTTEIVHGISREGLGYATQDLGIYQQRFADRLEALFQLMNDGWEKLSEPPPRNGPISPDRLARNLTCLSPAYEDVDYTYYMVVAMLLMDCIAFDRPGNYAQLGDDAHVALRRQLASQGLEQEWIFEALPKEPSATPIVKRDLEDPAQVVTVNIMSAEVNRILSELYAQPPTRQAGAIRALREKLLAWVKYSLHAQWGVVKGQDQYLDLISPITPGSSERWIDRLPPLEGLAILLRGLRTSLQLGEGRILQKNYLQSSRG